MAKWRRQTGHPEANRARTVLLGYNDGECTPFGTNKTGSSDVCRWHGSEKFETKKPTSADEDHVEGQYVQHSAVQCQDRGQQRQAQV
jgi:hypothetical protein